eukprot:CAMPEP_0197840560 /NCGR_PEP_ID=MMETSP1437-20131217/45677_1 /TAXON_ID=49252 ORGANISM="Eucampia antarctica, Strain CCMP1452" /NCGR_SAMPLE_ID=MMETSP1437 /ASSEMBLY_ACC=CAM_ASM_001096 /LENGTH=36 /DNA_ID= /DNA_START= /DNA_END= /DNA_ORIENTATION=
MAVDAATGIPTEPGLSVKVSVFPAGGCVIGICSLIE